MIPAYDIAGTVFGTVVADYEFNLEIVSLIYNSLNSTLYVFFVIVRNGTDTYERLFSIHQWISSFFKLIEGTGGGCSSLLHCENKEIKSG
jgi:hypothetical protein